MNFDDLCNIDCRKVLNQLKRNVHHCRIFHFSGKEKVVIVYLVTVPKRKMWQETVRLSRSRNEWHSKQAKMSRWLKDPDARCSTWVPWFGEKGGKKSVHQNRIWRRRRRIVGLHCAEVCIVADGSKLSAAKGRQRARGRKKKEKREEGEFGSCVHSRGTRRTIGGSLEYTSWASIVVSTPFIGVPLDPTRRYRRPEEPGTFENTYTYLG